MLLILLWFFFRVKIPKRVWYVIIQERETDILVNAVDEELTWKFQIITIRCHTIAGFPPQILEQTTRNFGEIILRRRIKVLYYPHNPLKPLFQSELLFNSAVFPFLFWWWLEIFKWIFPHSDVWEVDINSIFRNKNIHYLPFCYFKLVISVLQC